MKFPMTNLKFPKLIKFNGGQECAKLFIMLLNVEVHPPYGSPTSTMGKSGNLHHHPMCCEIFSSRNGPLESFNFAEKNEEMLDPAEIPLRLVQVRSYLSSNEQICEHFTVPDCACFLFNTRDANYEQNQHHVMCSW